MSVLKQNNKGKQFYKSFVENQLIKKQGLPIENIC